MQFIKNSSIWSTHLTESSSEETCIGKLKCLIQCYGAAMVEKRSGWLQFLDAMNQARAWVGDFELRPLAEYFHVNLDKHGAGLPYNIYFHCGSLPRHLFTVHQIEQLYTRGIINHPQPEDEYLELLPLPESDMISRVEAIPDPFYENLIGFLYDPSLQKASEPLKTTLSGLPLPRRFSKIAGTLLVRDLLTLNQERKEFTAVSIETALDRLAEIPGKMRIIEAWRAAYRSLPKLNIRHVNGNHWEYIPCQEEEPAPSLAIVPQPRLQVTPPVAEDQQAANMRMMTYFLAQMLAMLQIYHQQVGQVNISADQNRFFSSNKKFDEEKLVSTVRLGSTLMTQAPFQRQKDLFPRFYHHEKFPTKRLSRVSQEKLPCTLL